MWDEVWIQLLPEHAGAEPALASEQLLLHHRHHHLLGTARGVLEVSFAKASCDQEEFQVKAAQKSEVCGWGRNAEMCRVRIFISVKALSASTAGVTHLSALWSESAPREWNQYFSPLLAQGLALCHQERPQWDMKCPTSRGAGAGTCTCCWWLLDLTPQGANRPGSLPAGSSQPTCHSLHNSYGFWTLEQKVSAWLHLPAQLCKSCLSKLFLSLAQVVSPLPPFPCTLLFEGWALAGTQWHRLTAGIFHILVCPSGMWGRWEGLS